jgi:hypothetical protein
MNLRVVKIVVVCALGVFIATTPEAAEWIVAVLFVAWLAVELAILFLRSFME